MMIMEKEVIQNIAEAIESYSETYYDFSIKRVEVKDDRIGFLIEKNEELYRTSFALESITHIDIPVFVEDDKNGK